MKAYAHKLANRWYGFIQSPIGFWLPLEAWSETKEACEQRLRDAGFTVVQRD